MNLPASVLLSTYNMPRHLLLVLQGLAHQSIKLFEVLLCDDGSNADTREVVSQIQTEHPTLKLEHLWQPQEGFRKCRILNEGIRRSRGNYLIFLDGDCVPHPKFIEDHLENSESGHYLAGRRIELSKKLTESLLNEGWNPRFFSGWSLRLAMDDWFGESTHSHRSRRLENKWLRKYLGLEKVVDLKGCNFSVAKDDIIKINGFDESFQGYGREDTDVELRLQHLGLRIKSLKGLAVQYHLWHERRSFTPANDARLEELRRNPKLIRAERGLN